MKVRFYTVQMLCLYTLHFVFYRCIQKCEDILLAVLPKFVLRIISRPEVLGGKYQMGYIAQALDSAMHRKESINPIWEVGHYRLDRLRELYVNQKLEGIQMGEIGTYKSLRFLPYKKYRYNELNRKGKIAERTLMMNIPHQLPCLNREIYDYLYYRKYKGSPVEYFGGQKDRLLYGR